MRHVFKNTHHPLIKNVWEGIRVLFCLGWSIFFVHEFFVSAGENQLFCFIMSLLFIYTLVINILINVNEKYIVHTMIVKNKLFFYTLFGKKYKSDISQIVCIRDVKKSWVMKQSRVFTAECEYGFEIVIKNHHPFYVIDGIEGREKLRAKLTEIAEDNQKSRSVDVNKGAFESCYW